MESPQPRNEIIEGSIAKLTTLLENYSNEIPDQLLKGGGRPYKVTAGWFQCIFDTIDLIDTELGLDPDFRKKAEELCNAVHKKRREGSEIPKGKTDSMRTTQKEIDAADDLLKELIEYLQGL